MKEEKKPNKTINFEFLKNMNSKEKLNKDVFFIQRLERISFSSLRNLTDALSVYLVVIYVRYLKKMEFIDCFLL